MRTSKATTGQNPTRPPPPRGAAALELDRESPLPLYAQVSRRLKAMISAGEHPSDRFHSEIELCAMFGVSRATVRQAMRALSDEGWLHRQQGRGTSVNREKFDEAFVPQMNFLDQWARDGHPLVFELRRFEVATCPPEFTHWLGLEAGTPVLCIERLRRDGEQPVSYDYRYLHPDLSGSIRREEASGQSLLVLLGRHVRLKRGENKVEATLAGARGATLLGVSASDPVLIREMVYLGDDAVPAMAGRSLYRADRVRCSFSVDLSADGVDSSLQPVQTAPHPGGIADTPDVAHWPPRARHPQPPSPTPPATHPSEVS